MWQYYDNVVRVSDGGTKGDRDSSDICDCGSDRIMLISNDGDSDEGKRDSEGDESDSEGINDWY